MSHITDRINFHCGKCFKYIDKMSGAIKWVTDPSCHHSKVGSLVK